ncbi:MAG: hypothetical protein AB7I37_08730 [Pirellulales bacterium]
MQKELTMRFIEMTGATLLRVIDKDEMRPEDLRKAGVSDNSIVRVNPQGDIELRKNDGWDVVGGLLGDFDHRVRQATGLNWA